MDWEELNDEYDKLVKKIRKDNNIPPGVDVFDFKLDVETSKYLRKLISLRRLGRNPESRKDPPVSQVVLNSILYFLALPGFMVFGIMALGDFIKAPGWLTYCAAAFPIFVMWSFFTDRTSQKTMELEEYIIMLEERLHKQEELLQMVSRINESKTMPDEK